MNIPAVAFESFGFSFPAAAGPTRPAIDGIDMVVARGGFALFVGASGSGKSTLLRAVNGTIPHATGGAVRGRIRVAGRDPMTSRPRDLADVVGFVHQDPEAQFVVDEVEADIAFVLENLGLDRTAMRRRVEEVLDALDIAHLRARPPSALSGGEQQRVAIAGALAANPAVLVLDEPTSQLDPQGAEHVLAAVGRLNSDLGTTILVAEHRLDRTAPLADSCAALDAGRVVRSGPPAEVLASYEGAPAVTRLAAVLGWSPPPLTVREALRLPLPELPPPQRSASAPGDRVLEATDLVVEKGGRRVLRGIDVTLREGEVVALLGRNGSGKTTLLRALARLDRPAGGAVHHLQGRVAYVPQNPDALLSAETVADEVAHTLRLLGSPVDPDRIRGWLDRLGLLAHRDRHPRSLSSGERQRLAVAAVAVGGAPVLLLDEPTRGMDAASRTALAGAVMDHADGGGTVMLATHDVELAARCAARAVVLGDGDVVAEGGTADVLSGSLFAPQVLRVAPPFLTVDEVRSAMEHRR